MELLFTLIWWGILVGIGYLWGSGKWRGLWESLQSRLNG